MHDDRFDYDPLAGDDPAPDPALVEELDERADATPSGRRWHVPAAVMAVMVAALVGGVVMGSLFPVRNDGIGAPSEPPEVAIATDAGTSPTPTPIPTATHSSTPIPTPTASPSAEPVANAESTASPGPTTQPATAAAPRPTPSPAARWTELPESVAAYANVGDTTIGPDGRLYTFFYGARVPERGRSSGTTPVAVLDPADGSLELRAPAGGTRMGSDAEVATGDDGLLYVTGWGPESTLVFGYDPMADAFVPDTEIEVPVSAWDAVAGGDGLIYLLVFPRDGTTTLHAYDPTTDVVTQVAEDDRSGLALIADPDGNPVILGEDGARVYDLDKGAWRTLTDEMPGPDVWGKMAAAGPDGQLLVVFDRFSIGWFDGDTWEFEGVPDEVVGVSYVDGRWLLITVEPEELPGPVTVRYWESAGP